MWHFTESGGGPPLVLLHGIGMSHRAWDAVIPHLRTTRHVVAFDIAGFGDTPRLPAGTPPTIVRLVDGLDRSLREIGLDLPVDIAGNSLGGSLALEAARRGLARSVVAIAPAGLWTRHGAPHVPIVFGGMRLLATRAPVVLKAVARSPLLRELAFAVPLSVGSRRMRAADAVQAVEDLARAHGFEATFAATRPPFVARDITVPVTVVFGNRDWILTKGSRNRDALPAHTKWMEKPGWGHVPMGVDPAGVAQVILRSTDLFHQPMLDGHQRGLGAIRDPELRMSNV